MKLRPRMRILHIDTERGWRGGERQTFWLAAELERRGHPSVVAARIGEPLIERARQAGLRTVECDPAFEADPRTALTLRLAIRREKIDIVHAHTAHAVALAALATLGTRIPFVAARRVDFPLRKNAGTRWKYGRAARIVAVSRAAGDIVARGGIARDRINVVPDGVDLHRHVDATPRESLVPLGVPLDAPLVVQVAQFTRHKDPVTFVRAIAEARKHVPNVQAIMAGDGPLRSAVDDEIARLSLGNTVHPLGYRLDADGLIATADVVTLTSEEEGLGSVLLDALMLGKPVVATERGGIPEAVADGVTGFLAPGGDAESLGRHIATLLGDDALRARMGAAARERANEFSLEKMAERTLAVYESVIG